MIAILLLFAFIAGLIFLKLGYPPLLGYLLAGFLGHALRAGSIDTFDYVAELGVTMLLFTIGLKLRPAGLLKPYIVAPAVLHMVVVIPLTAAVIMVAGNLYPPLAFDKPVSAWVLAFALSFSSTVFAIKIFAERGESSSFYAAIAIGVLVIQDLIAVLFLVLMADTPPSFWALSLLLIPLLWRWLRPLIERIMGTIGHGELQLLFGFLIALGAYELFELLHLKGGLGALVAGALLASADRRSASELYKRLADVKDLFLIGFFMQIGYYGIPSLPMLLVACGLALVLLLRPLVYFAFFTRLNLRARTAWLSSAGLFTYSEFGLIVASIAVSANLIHQEWLVTLALSIAVSFFVATSINKAAHTLYRRHSNRLTQFERDTRLQAETIASLGTADVVVLGMGRVGRSAYEYLNTQYPQKVIGIEENYQRTLKLKEQGYNVVHGDATDRDFWERTALHKREALYVSLTNHTENLAVVDLARIMGFTKKLAVTARFEDEKEQLGKLGCIAYNVFADVGLGFAEYADRSKKTRSADFI